VPEGQACFGGVPLPRPAVGQARLVAALPPRQRPRCDRGSWATNTSAVVIRVHGHEAAQAPCRRPHNVLVAGRGPRVWEAEFPDPSLGELLHSGDELVEVLPVRAPLQHRRLIGRLFRTVAVMPRRDGFVP